MGRWLLVGLSILGFAFAFGTTSPGVLALGLLVGAGGLVGALLAFAAARIEGVSQQSSREVAMILEARKHKAAAERQRGAALPAAGGTDGGPKTREPSGDDGGSDGGSGD